MRGIIQILAQDIELSNIPASANRFVFTPMDLTAVIEDYRYYADHEVEIDAWLDEHDCERTGMIITFCDEETKMLFALRWS